MEMPELIKFITENGVIVAVMAYFMFRDWKFMGKLSQTLQVLVDTIQTLKESIINKGDNK